MHTSGFQTMYAVQISPPHQFEKAFFGLCRAMVIVHWGERKRACMHLFSLHHLSESSFSCLGARTEVAVYPERVKGLAGRKVAKATGNIAGMMLKEEGVWADRES